MSTWASGSRSCSSQSSAVTCAGMDRHMRLIPVHGERYCGRFPPASTPELSRRAKHSPTNVQRNPGSSGARHALLDDRDPTLAAGKIEKAIYLHRVGLLNNPRV